MLKIRKNPTYLSCDCTVRMKRKATNQTRGGLFLPKQIIRANRKKWTGAEDDRHFTHKELMKPCLTLFKEALKSVSKIAMMKIIYSY